MTLQADESRACPLSLKLIAWESSVERQDAAANDLGERVRVRGPAILALESQRCTDYPLIRPVGQCRQFNMPTQRKQLPLEGGEGTLESGLLWSRRFLRLTRSVQCRARLSRFILRLCVLFLFLAQSTISFAQDKPPVRLKMELLSIRNRSSGPLPVRIKLEYNLQQNLEGDLELSIYDALDATSNNDLMATIRREGIVLAGQDYIFNTVLPPLRTSSTKNWAIVAWFITKDERIPLSSLLDRIDPPEPHDLLITDALERGTLLCSCVEEAATSPTSANRRFLETALSLDNYNPIYNELESRKKLSSENQTPGQMTGELIGRTIIHFAGQWAARDMPVDPLSYCAFDLVLLSDGALARLNEDQLTGLQKWVRAGGSVCILPDAPMKPMHLEWLRKLFEHGSENAANLTLASDGTLLVVDAQPDQSLLSHYGLGRAVLLPAVDNLQDKLEKPTLGRIVAFLWKVRLDQPVWQGELWTSLTLLEMLKQQGVDAQVDERGVYVTDTAQSRILGFFGASEVDGRYYISAEQLQSVWGVNDRIRPRAEPLLSIAATALLPTDVEMVPTWVIGLILTGYVFAIGPVDYLLLGWLRLRKYTWVLFPIVTAFFTGLTVVIANAYMGSEDTGGQLIITDLVDDGLPARQSTLETLYYSAQTVARTDRKSALVVRAESSTARDPNAQFGRAPAQQTRVPLNYSGHFPQNYTISHQVQQWSPVSLRSLTLEPENVQVPSIDWSDVSLVTTPEGNAKLALQLNRYAAEKQRKCHAAIYHKGGVTSVVGSIRNLIDRHEQHHPWQNQYQYVHSRDAMINQLLEYIPTMNTSSENIFRIVCQIAPHGAGSLEDLAFLDASDPKQWALFVVEEEKSDFHVFRKLYVVEE